MNIYLKADSLEDLQAALVEAGILEFDFPAVRVNPWFLLDYIGQVSVPTGELDSEGQPVFAPTSEEYFANLKVLRPCQTFSEEVVDSSPEWLTEQQLAALSDYLLPEPNSPYRIWAK